MTDRRTIDLAPENHNAEQDDESSQAQILTEEAQSGTHRHASPIESTRHKSPGALDEASEQDLVDHMRDMESSGRIDNDAYAGEDNHDDNEEKYGEGAKLDKALPADGS